MSEEGILPVEGEPQPPVAGSKKQQRIAELVKAQLRGELKNELVEELETRLDQLAARRGPMAEGDAPALIQVLDALRQAGLEHDAEALRLLRQARGGGPQGELRALADLAALALARAVTAKATPQGAASRAIPPGGGAAPPPDLRAEYERRLRGVRPGDLGAVMELKREFRRRGLEVY